MGKFLLRRLLLALLILFLISLIVFVVVEILPGDTATMILGQRATPETVSALRIRLGLDRPGSVRYLEWIGGYSARRLGHIALSQCPGRAAVDPTAA